MCAVTAAPRRVTQSRLVQRRTWKGRDERLEAQQAGGSVCSEAGSLDIVDGLLLPAIREHHPTIEHCEGRECHHERRTQQ